MSSLTAASDPHDPRTVMARPRTVRPRALGMVGLAFPLVLWQVACHRSSHDPAPAAGDPAEVVAGERLFLETRFAQFFAVNGAGDVNAPLGAGDPTLDLLQHADGSTFTGPFEGQSMNCRNCHLVDEMDGVAGAGIRAYADFAQRSPIPARADGLTVTLRNSPPLVNSSFERDGGVLFHFDGEFASLEELVRGTLTGRNYGWLADEGATAMAHVARVLREDDGSGDLAAEFGGLSYAALLLGGSDVPAEFRLPSALRVDVATATDEELLDAAAALIAAYVAPIEFERDGRGRVVGSPFDLFLIRNELPREPRAGESNEEFSDRQGAALVALVAPKFVAANDGEFVHHAQDFVFGADELEGARIFFARPATLPASPGEVAAGAIGNCVACHYGANFTDFELHNSGVSQAEYELVHGGGTFDALTIPDATTRASDAHQFLPPTAADPTAEGIYARIADTGDPRFADLGAWNVFANPAVPGPQSVLRELLAELAGLDPQIASDDDLLPFAIATFKTPGLRDLADGDRYMHSGAFETIEEVIDHYAQFADLARAGGVRNADAELGGIALQPADGAPLAAFLRSLTHDYD